MIEKAVIFIILVAAFVGTLFYLKRKKADIALIESASSKNNDIKASASVSATAQVEATKPSVAPLAEQIVPIAAEPVQNITPIVTETVDNEDPILKRHHLNAIRLMVIATTFPHPTDSTLSRHYDEMIDAKAEDCLADEIKMARLVADYEACQQPKIAVKTTAPVQIASVQVAASQASSISVSHKTTAIPEDSALRRHYLSALRTNIEKNHAPRPTDSALRRHYDAMIAAELDKQSVYH